MKAELQSLPSCEPDGRHWFWHGEQVLALLEEHRPSVSVELGTWKGGSAIAVARVVQRWGGQMFCIDRWDGPVSRSACAANIRQAGVSDAVTLIQSSTVDAAKAWQIPIDYLYVDADHSANGCYADLISWWPHLRSGGLLAGDDYDDPRWGVTEAWDRFEQDYGQTFHRRATPGSDPACTRLIWGFKA